MDGSSINSSRGSSISARASSTSFCSPPDSEPARASRRSRDDGEALARPPRARAARRSRQQVRAHAARCPRPSSAGTGCAPAAPARRRGRSIAPRPKAVELGGVEQDVPRGRSSPHTGFSTVDLPAPLGPMTHVTRPGCTSRSTPREDVAAPRSRRATPSIVRACGLDVRPPGRRRARPDRAAHLGRRALRDLLAVVEHDHRVAEPHHEVHVVLDDQEGEALARGAHGCGAPCARPSSGSRPPSARRAARAGRPISTWRTPAASAGRTRARWPCGPPSRVEAELVEQPRRAPGPARPTRAAAR